MALTVMRLASPSAGPTCYFPPHNAHGFVEEPSSSALSHSQGELYSQGFLGR